MRTITIILLMLIFLSSIAYGQQPDKWLDKIENPKYEIDRLKKENVKSNYLKYDFSTLLIPRNDFLGYIGPDYRRLNIFFTTITKNQADSKQYDIKGVSIVGANKCDFKGILTIGQIREFQAMHLGVDDIYKDAGFKAQGLLIGNYELREDSAQKHSGILKGIMTLYWYVDKFGIVHYDNIERSSDRYCNNQYIGIWTEYHKSDSKVCNWGEHRIPFSGDLDLGAGEFSPNKKYYDKGWKDYKIE